MIDILGQEKSGRWSVNGKLNATELFLMAYIINIRYIEYSSFKLKNIKVNALIKVEFIINGDFKW